VKQDVATREGTAELELARLPGKTEVEPGGGRGFWKDALRRRMLAAADLGAVFAAAAVAGLVEGGATGLWVAATAPLWVVLAKMRGLYDRDHVRIRHLTLDDSSALFHWAMLGGTGTALFIVALPGDLLSVGGALAIGATAFAGAFALRAMARPLWRWLVPPERGLILGSGPLADAFARRLALQSGHHVAIAVRVGLAGKPKGRPGPDAEPLISLDELEAIVRAERIERVVVALQDLNEETLAHVVSTCRQLGVKLSVAPPLRAMLGTAVDLNHLLELPLIEFRTWDASRSTMLVKRTIDVVGASVALASMAPLMLAIALVIRADSRGPALFRQRRAGRNAVEFEMLKFRTMAVDAESRVGEVVAVDELAEPVFKLRSDPRVTRVGRLLRRTSLDELPQLVNVLRGEMSLVGPRPEETWLVERYEEADRFRLDMRPGITGPMQVHGRGELTFSERVAVEREYVENYSLRKDFKILFQTFSAVVGGRGAY
jgi:exopolysaccharide biosynthesis polyprenyl glycosylphosphotransferase